MFDLYTRGQQKPANQPIIFALPLHWGLAIHPPNKVLHLVDQNVSGSSLQKEMVAIEKKKKEVENILKYYVKKKREKKGEKECMPKNNLEHHAKKYSLWQGVAPNNYHHIASHLHLHILIILYDLFSSWVLFVILQYL